jgi:hypothetical protein
MRHAQQARVERQRPAGRIVEVKARQRDDVIDAR